MSWHVNTTDPDRFVLPSLRAEVSAWRQADMLANGKPRPTPVKPSEPPPVYPFLGTTTHLSMTATETPGRLMPGAVLGPSNPICGQRKDAKPFEDLSALMADLSWKRTTSIMVGSRPGC